MPPIMEIIRAEFSRLLSLAATIQKNHWSPLRAAALLITLGWTALLASCAAPAQTNADFSQFRVVCYEPPIETASWTARPALAVDPEGAAFDIANAMQQGDVDRWLSYCGDAHQASLGLDAREALLRQWQSLQGGAFAITTRVIAGMDMIVELSLVNSKGQPQKLQIPLTKAHDRWWLTTMDPGSEFLHWENAPNKIVDRMDPNALGRMHGALQSVAVSR